jgi:hypothetical protein
MKGNVVSDCTVMTVCTLIILLTVDFCFIMNELHVQSSIQNIEECIWKIRVLQWSTPDRSFYDIDIMSLVLIFVVI